MEAFKHILVGHAKSGYMFEFSKNERKYLVTTSSLLTIDKMKKMSLIWFFGCRISNMMYKNRKVKKNKE